MERAYMVLFFASSVVVEPLRCSRQKLDAPQLSTGSYSSLKECSELLTSILLVRSTKNSGTSSILRKVPFWCIVRTQSEYRCTTVYETAVQKFHATVVCCVLPSARLQGNAWSYNYSSSSDRNRMRASMPIFCTIQNALFSFNQS